MFRAQAPTVPNEIVIEAMINGLRPGPTEHILPGSPHKPERSFYRRWMSTTKPTMISDKARKKLTYNLRWPGASKECSTQGMSGRYTIPAKVKTEAITTKGINIVSSHLGRSKAPSDHQPQEAEGDEALEEDLAHNQEDCFVCSMEKIRGTQLGHSK
jgi:hypothetical protein